MPESNTKVIPQEWLTIKTLKTVSGAALCCWLVTLFFDLLCFMPIRDPVLHSNLVVIASTTSCISMAIYKTYSTQKTRTKLPWLLALPNAMLIYIHALGFQVASKELALRAYANEIKKEQAAAVKTAGLGSAFYFLTRQTAWIPGLGTDSNVTSLKAQVNSLNKVNQHLTDSIQQLREQLNVPATPQPVASNDQSLADSIASYKKQLSKCASNNTTLKIRIDSLEADRKRSISNFSGWKEYYAQKDKREAALIKRIEEKNALIRKWKISMEVYRNPETEMKRVMNGYVGDESFYNKLFQLMSTQ